MIEIRQKKIKIREKKQIGKKETFSKKDTNLKIHKRIKYFNYKSI